MSMRTWSEDVAASLIQKKGTEHNFLVASGISPSGPVHIGNLRELLTAHFVKEALTAEGANASLHFSWDDFDRFRKIPYGLPEEFTTHIGKPLADIPDPTGEFDSFATRHIVNFQAAAEALGVEANWVRQSEKYRNGDYVDEIRHSLNSRKEIADILTQFRTQGMTTEERESFFPISVYSRFTGKDTTRVLKWDGDEVLTYKCNETGKSDQIRLSDDTTVKLQWKVDWPMRWMKEGVDFEPGGHDHASPQGSYQVGRVIAEKIFDFKAPDFIEYGFVRVRGENKKMSSSTGNVITPEELLNVYPPEIAMWIYERASPSSEIEIALDEEVFRTYAEFDREHESKIMGFRQVVGYLEATGLNTKLSLDLIRNADEKLSQRADRAKYWIEKHSGREISVVLNEPNREHLVSLSPEEQAQLERVYEATQSAESLEELEGLLYEIPKEEGMSKRAVRSAQGTFFKNTYKAVTGKESGPRLSTFLYANRTANLEHLLLAKE